MYVPPAFEIEDRAWAADLIERYPFGLLVTCDAEYPRASHIPMLARLERDGALSIFGHVAKANEHAQSIAAGATATAIFQGPHAYVSAAWYEEPYLTVPTWNYMAVHACGRLQECDSYPVLEQLTATFEAGKPEPWRLDRLDPDYIQKQLKGIVAFELRVEKLYAKAKLSQNRTAADRARVTAELLHARSEIERACGEAMAVIERG